MRKYLFRIAMGMMGLSMIFMMSACAKKQVKEAPPAAKEERVTPEPEVVQPPMESAPIQESESASKGTETEGLSVILFDFDKYNIRDDQRPVIEANASWLKAHPDVKVTIEGHCDERGTNEYNLALGERRAKTTQRVLASLGVDKARLSTISYGEERPVCTEKTESCYSRNRRAQFKLAGR
jgi:peptidoglycan-associated lipoprotein